MQPPERRRGRRRQRATATVTKTQAAAVEACRGHHPCQSRGASRPGPRVRPELSSGARRVGATPLESQPWLAMLQCKHISTHGTSWGCRESTLRQIYQAYARAYVEYASPAWWPYISAAQRRQLEVQQNHAARIVTGCAPRTRIVVLLTEAGLRPPSLRMDEQLLVARERFRRLPRTTSAYIQGVNVPLTERATQWSKTPELPKTDSETLPVQGRMPTWMGECNVQFCTEFGTYPHLYKAPFPGFV